MAKNAARLFEGKAPEHNALRSRGCPDPDRAILHGRRVKSRKALRAEREMAAQASTEYITRRRMHAAQDAVRAAKAAGQDTTELARAARAARAEWLSVTGGVESRYVEAPIAPTR